MNLGLGRAQLLLLLGKDNDVEPHSRQAARLVVTYHAMLCVPVEHHTSATPVCIVCWICLAALRLDWMQMFTAERKAANFNVAALRYGQPSLCLKYRQQRPCDSTE